MSRRLPASSRLALITGMTAMAVVAPGWSNPTWASAPAVHPHGHTASPSVHEPLSGKWSGRYSGSFSGTFRLAWQQSAQNLSGTITVSGFDNVPMNIHGTVHGVSIRFGTVGSESITYSGTSSGKSMSGTWLVQAGGRSLGNGSWDAFRSS
jgi:hypothetical protein